MNIRLLMNTSGQSPRCNQVGCYHHWIPNQVGNDNAVAGNGVVLVEDDFRVIPDLIGDPHALVIPVRPPGKAEVLEMQEHFLMKTGLFVPSSSP